MGRIGCLSLCLMACTGSSGASTNPSPVYHSVSVDAAADASRFVDACGPVHPTAICNALAARLGLPTETFVEYPIGCEVAGACLLYSIRVDDGQVAWCCLTDDGGAP